MGNALLPTLYRSFTRQHTLRHAAPIVQSVFATRQYSATARCLQDSKPSPAPSGLPSTPAASSKPDFSSLIDQALDFTKQAPNASRNSRSSLDDLSASFGPRRGRASPSSGGFDMASMLDPTNRTASPAHSSTPQPLILPDPLPAYGPSVGRTVEVNVNRGMDVGRAFRSLEINCARNKVRADFQRQRFHERPGLKRKRLRSERWRRRFREGFRGMVKMVSAMKKQGW